MGVPDHLTCLLKILYAGQEAKQQLEPDMEQWTGSKLGKKYVKAVHCHPAYYLICRVHHWARLDEVQSGIRIAGRNSNNLSYADDTILVAESKAELIASWGWKKSEKAGLKLNTQKSKIMASSSITAWQVDGGKVGTVTDFLYLGSKITVDSAYIHEIKRRSLEGKL